MSREEIKMTTTTLYRDSYGSLCAKRWAAPPTTDSDRALLAQAYTLCNRAAAIGQISAATDDISFDSKGRADGSAVHHEIYDLKLERGAVRTVLVCVRETEGTRYGVKTLSKAYYLITKTGRTTVTVPASKSTSAKFAKLASRTLGTAIAGVQGKIKYTPPALKPAVGYKIVAKTESGDYVSVFDCSSWTLGVERCEQARDDHGGGYYYYDSVDEAIRQAALNETFHTAWVAGKKLVAVECQVRGNRVRYDNDKIAATRLKPIREIASVLLSA
jgi:hypothetical protein